MVSESNLKIPRGLLLAWIGAWLVKFGLLFLPIYSLSGLDKPQSLTWFIAMGFRDNPMGTFILMALVVSWAIIALSSLRPVTPKLVLLAAASLIVERILSSGPTNENFTSPNWANALDVLGTWVATALVLAYYVVEAVKCFSPTESQMVSPTRHNFAEPRPRAHGEQHL
ncbi:MAG: hypothetical protein K1X67_00310 [Fimbriimonadaceae bacterium]|nr:hypothetical protein [Fimbriimonadaceae bacterium]